MNIPWAGKKSQPCKAVDQLCNTLDLMDWGFLDFALFECQTPARKKSDVREYFIQIKQSLEQAGSLLGTVNGWTASLKASKNEVFYQQLNVLADTMEEIASQANFLALNVAIGSAYAGRQGLEWSLTTTEIRALSRRATWVTSELNELLSRFNCSGTSTPAGVFCVSV